MALELAELAAGLPFAASFAVAGGISALREGRRRIALNEAIHELRRPLQVIAFLTPGSTDRAEALESSLRLAAAAVERLEGEINGRPVPDLVEAVSVRPLVESAVERLRARASLEGRVVNLKWKLGDTCLLGNAIELARAVDNLISNGLAHGSGEVTVEAVSTDNGIRLIVGNRKRSKPSGLRWRRRDLGGRVSGRRRHGHGLRIVRRVAEHNGGSFHLRRCGERCEAVLELPLVGAPR